MAQSITLQTSDPVIVSGDNIGRLSFAASSESSAGDSIKIAASVYAEAEGEFTSTANSTSLIFATAASDSATGQYKITSLGHFEPFISLGQNLGASNKVFNTLYVDNIQSISEGIILNDNIPSITTNALYNSGGQLYFNGSGVGGGSSNTYLADSGITLVNDTFIMGGTGTLTKLNTTRIDFADPTNTTHDHIALGTNSISASNNTISIGRDSALSGATSINMINIGYQAAYLSSGNHASEINIGTFAGRYAYQSLDNINIGGSAGEYANGSYNLNFGFRAGQYFNNLLSTSNINLGNQAGRYADGSFNDYIGYNAGTQATGSNNIEIVTQGPTVSVIGANSNKIHIENTIIGDTSSKRLAIGNISSVNLLPNSTLEIINSSASIPVLIVQGAASQSENLQEWQNSSSNILSYVDNAGNYSGNNIIFGNGTTQTTAFSIGGNPGEFQYNDGGTGLAGSDGFIYGGNTTGNILEIQSTGGDILFYVDHSGNISGNNILFNNGSGYNLNISGNVTLISTGIGPILDIQNSSGSSIFTIEDAVYSTILAIAQSGQINYLLELQNEFNSIISYIDTSGNYSGNNIIFGDNTVQTTAYTGPPQVITDTGTGIILSCSIHANNYLRTLSDNPITITISSGLGCNANTEFTFEQAGSGQITVEAESGVTINTSSTLKSYTQYSVIAIKQVDTDIYTLFGDTASF